MLKRLDRQRQEKTTEQDQLVVQLDDDNGSELDEDEKQRNDDTRQEDKTRQDKTRQDNTKNRTKDQDLWLLKIMMTRKQTRQNDSRQDHITLDKQTTEKQMKIT